MVGVVVTDERRKKDDSVSDTVWWQSDGGSSVLLSLILIWKILVPPTSPDLYILHVCSYFISILVLFRIFFLLITVIKNNPFFSGFCLSCSHFCVRSGVLILWPSPLRELWESIPSLVSNYWYFWYNVSTIPLENLGFQFSLQRNPDLSRTYFILRLSLSLSQ